MIVRERFVVVDIGICPFAIMKKQVTARINTLEGALEVARRLIAVLRTESRAKRNYQVFSAFTNDRLEALTAYLIWRIKGQHLIPDPNPNTSTGASIRFSEPRSRSRAYPSH